jgi:hypothetical protein
MLAVDAGSKGEDLVFHLTPLSIGISSNVTAQRDAKQASKIKRIMRKKQPPRGAGRVPFAG